MRQSIVRNKISIFFYFFVFIISIVFSAHLGYFYFKQDYVAKSNVTINRLMQESTSRFSNDEMLAKFEQMKVMVNSNVSIIYKGKVFDLGMSDKKAIAVAIFRLSILSNEDSLFKKFCRLKVGEKNYVLFRHDSSIAIVEESMNKPINMENISPSDMSIYKFYYSKELVNLIESIIKQ